MDLWNGRKANLAIKYIVMGIKRYGEWHIPEVNQIWMKNPLIAEFDCNNEWQWKALDMLVLWGVYYAPKGLGNTCPSSIQRTFAARRLKCFKRKSSIQCLEFDLMLLNGK